MNSLIRTTSWFTTFICFTALLMQEVVGAVNPPLKLVHVQVDTNEKRISN
jgi:hypothetical protein